MGSADLQRQYWAANHVLKRRPPTHPAVRGFVAPKLAFVRECLEGRMGKRLSELSVLDVGAGNGFFTHYLMEAFGHVTAMDFSMLILAANPARAKVLGDVNALPFPDRSFDVVLCSNLLHHVVHPQGAVNEMARVADAALVVSEPNRNNPLMFSFGALVPSERGTLKFTHRFLRNLVTSATPGLKLVGTRTQGIMVPNKVPTWAVPVVRALEPFLFPRMYLLSVAERVQVAPPSV
ncbi:MAG: class I SAM-dependent methyltransferase [Longimicrobiales bacterium]